MKLPHNFNMKQRDEFAFLSSVKTHAPFSHSRCLMKSCVAQRRCVFNAQLRLRIFLEEENKMKTKLLSIILSLCMVMLFAAPISAASVDDLYFDMDTGTITGCSPDISGELVIPDTIENVTVTKIGTYAFMNQNGLTKITLPDTIETIESYAFYQCENLNEINLPKSLTYIDKGVFNGCNSLKTLKINSTNLVSANDIFQNNFGAVITESAIPENVIFGDEVTNIPESLLYGCYNIKEISIPASVTNIGNLAFCKCNALTKFKVSPDNAKYFSDENGVLFEKTENGNAIIQYPIGSTANTYVVPDNVNSIAEKAFYGAKNLEKISVSEDTTNIEQEAFSNIPNLKQIVIPQSVNKIGPYIFRILNEYSSEKYGKNLTVYGYNFSTAQHYSIIYGIPFVSIDKPEKIIPVTSIQLNYNNVTMEGGEYLFLLSKILPNDASNKSLIWESNNSKVAEVDSFGKVSALQPGEAIITVKTTDGNVYAQCNVTVKNNIYPATNVFLDNELEKAVYVGETIDLTNYSYAEAEQITHVSSSDLVVVEEMTWTSSDESVAKVENGKVIGIKAGNATISMTSSETNQTVSIEIVVREKNEQTTQMSSVETTDVTFYYEVVDNKAYILDSVITKTAEESWLPLFVDIKIPATVENDIPVVFFNGRVTYKKYNTLNTTITIPQYLKFINTNFQQHKEFSYGDLRITYITVDENNQYFSNDDSGVLFNKDQTELLYYPTEKTDTGYTVPNTVKKIRYDSICNSYLTNITLNSGLEIIDHHAFRGSSAITQINLPANVEEIGLYSLAQMNSIQKITVDENNNYFTADENGILYNKDKSELICYPKNNPTVEYTIPESVTSIRLDAFANGNTTLPLRNITIGKNINNLHEYTLKALGGFHELLGGPINTGVSNIHVDSNNTTYHSDNGVLLSKDGKTIIRAPFNKTTYNISDGVERIEKTAFQFCKIQKIEIPESVTSMGDFAFAGAQYLDDVKLSKNLSQALMKMGYTEKSVNKIFFENAKNFFGF